MLKQLFITILLISLNLGLLVQIRNRSLVSGITMEDRESDKFRKQQCCEEFLKQLENCEKSDLVKNLTVSMVMQNYEPQKLLTDDHLLVLYKNREYMQMLNAYEAVWSDVKYFPVVSESAFWEDTWMSAREYGGHRRHEGCDIFGQKNISGYYPVCSMTKGTVENIGWLPLGGYRIGIRALQGGYYYYAHLDSYEREFQVGDFVSAGEILGYMGNSGYGKEGTTGKFPVHLHLGIYIQTTTNRELSVNPYGVLRYIYKKNVKYSY